MLELIPVIEIGYSNQGIAIPKGPYWEHPEIWDNYNQESYIKAGFKDKLIPYLAGSSFYKMNDISYNNLIKLITDQTEGLRNGTYDEALPFSGGYVLHINSEDKYFPQCCGDLSDIIYWEKLLIQDNPFFYQGHPEPLVAITNDTVIFDFTVDEFDEKFVPTPSDIRIEFNKSDLHNAIEKVKVELQVFAEKVEKINIEQGFEIPNLDKLLIWGEDYVM